MRIDLLSGDRPQQASHDYAVARAEPLLDHAHVVDQRADLDLALLDHVVLVDHKEVAPALVAAERDIGDQQGILLFRLRHAHGLSGQQKLAFECCAETPACEIAASARDFEGPDHADMAEVAHLVVREQRL